MMKAYKITIDQKKQIENVPFYSKHYFNPVQNINGDWFIFEIEMSYLATNNSWKRVVLMEYIPPIQDDLGMVITE